MVNEYWGIDVSPTSLKAVKLEGSQNVPRLTEVDAVDFETSRFEEESAGNIRPEVQDGLFEFSSRHSFDSATISVSLPSHTTFNRFTTLPPVDEKTEQLVKHEAQQHIPFPLDEVIWDYQEIVREDGTIEVILFAIKKEIVNEFLSSLKRAGLDPNIIQFSSVALYNFIQFDRPVDRTTAVLDLGANNCDLIIIEGDRHWTRDISVAAGDFTEALQRELDVSFDKAEQIKRGIANSSQSEKYMNVLKPVYRNLVQEVDRSIGFYKSMSSGSTIDQVFLTGGGARTHELDEFISENMDLPVSVISKLNRVEFSDDLDEEQYNRIAVSVGPATGLALQGMGATANRMNLVPERIVREKEFQRKKPFVIAAVVLFGLAALLYITSLRLRYSIYSDRAERLSGQQQEVNATLKKINQTKSKSSTERLRTIGKQFNQSVPNRQLPVLFLNKLTNVTPDNQALQKQLNSILLPYFKKAAQNQNLPGSYTEFRGMENPGEKWKQVQNEARKVEKKFLYVLGVDHNQGDEETRFDVYCGIFQRESLQDGRTFVKQTVSEPLRNTFDFQETDVSEAEISTSQGGGKDGTVNQLTSPFSEESDALGEGSAGGRKNFRVWRVRFIGDTSELRSGAISIQE